MSNSNSNWAVEMALEFKKRDNESPLTAILGEVISIEPLKIAVYDNKVILTSKEFRLCSSLVNSYVNKADVTIKPYSVSVNATDSRGDSISSLSVSNKTDYDVEIRYKQVLKKGDIVLCLPLANGQKYVIVDKVV